VFVFIVKLKHFIYSNQWSSAGIIKAPCVKSLLTVVFRL